MSTPKATRPRIDYKPGRAAQSALDMAAGLFPGLGNQELIDKLIITGLSALAHAHWQPPALYGNDRDRWSFVPPGGK